MTEFTMRAPLASEPDVMPTSFLEHMAASLGKMCGGMISDGTNLEAGNDSIGLMCVQSVLCEAGLEPLLLGLAPAIDSQSSFIALADGSIWRIRFTIKDGSLEAEAHQVGSEECTEYCASLPAYHELIKVAVSQKLNEIGWIQNGDSVEGHINTEAHPAICMRAKGNGRFIVHVGETNDIRGGFDFHLDCARPNAMLEELVASVSVTLLDKDQIKQEIDNNKAAFGVSNPFPTKVGQA